METIILEKLAEKGINVKGTGIDSVLIKMIKEAIEDVKTFGFSYWEDNTTAGPKVKSIVIELSK